MSEMEALLARRADIERQHATAVAKLEAERHHDGSRVRRNRRACAKLYDELATVQKSIDELVAERRR